MGGFGVILGKLIPQLRECYCSCDKDGTRAKKTTLISKFSYCRIIWVGRLLKTSHNWSAFSARKWVPPVISVMVCNVGSSMKRKRLKSRSPHEIHRQYSLKRWARLNKRHLSHLWDRCQFFQYSGIYNNRGAADYQCLALILTEVFQQYDHPVDQGGVRPLNHFLYFFFKFVKTIWAYMAYDDFIHCLVIWPGVFRAEYRFLLIPYERKD